MNGADKYWAVVPAAGRGTRMGADIPKQYLKLNGKKVIEHTLERLLSAELFAGIVVAVSEKDSIWPQLPIFKDSRITVASGGAERADSVLSAVNSLADSVDSEDWVLVHDAARCCITVTDIRRLIQAVKDDPVGGILALPVHDTLKAVEHGRVTSTVDRSRIWRALTPQMFRYSKLKTALTRAAEGGDSVTDEAGAMESIGANPKIVEGRPDNIKITRQEDLALANFYLEQQCYE